MVDFLEIRYDDDFIWAKAYHLKTGRYFDVKIFRKEWKWEISQGDCDWEVFKAAGNLLFAHGRRRFFARRVFGDVG